MSVSLLHLHIFAAFLFVGWLSNWPMDLPLLAVVHRVCLWLEGVLGCRFVQRFVVLRPLTGLLWSLYSPYTINLYPTRES